MLFIMLCSFEQNACMPPLEGGMFVSEKECIKDGYAKSQKVLELIDKKALDKNEYKIIYTCGELNERV
jgi:hypothetical protein